MTHDLEHRLGYTFSKRELLERALTHRSYANENNTAGVVDNETLEFLGDAVLDLVISHRLMVEHPALTEGQLSSARAGLVSESALAEVARTVSLGKWLRLGKGEERSGGGDKNSLLADALEALLAAVYLDGGVEAARGVIDSLFASSLAGYDASDNIDYKTRLQEAVQATDKIAPTYEVVAETGPDHDKEFEVAVLVLGKKITTASGKSKKLAEQRAAKRALEEMWTAPPKA